MKTQPSESLRFRFHAERFSRPVQISRATSLAVASPDITTLAKIVTVAAAAAVVMLEHLVDYAAQALVDRIAGLMRVGATALMARRGAQIQSCQSDAQRASPKTGDHLHIDAEGRGADGSHRQTAASTIAETGGMVTPSPFSTSVRISGGRSRPTHRLCRNI